MRRLDPLQLELHISDLLVDALSFGELLLSLSLSCAIVSTGDQIDRESTH